ncbi:MAG: glycosyltransferase [Chloroflexi bacterium]|nr:glycosyltransferase [Chloroflexota bacterium]
MTKRFLLLFSDTGGGHRSGAQAVAQALESLYGDAVSVTLVDAFVGLQKWPFYRFPAWYPRMLKVHSLPWKVGFELVDHPPIVNSLTKLTSPYIWTSFRHVLASHPADVIVSFHPIPNRLLAMTVARWGLDVSTATVVLDFLSAPAFWFAEGLDLYIVPYAEMIERARHMGLDTHQVEALGMPIRQEILAGLQISTTDAKKSLDIDTSRPLVLLLGGGDGVGPLDEIAQELFQLQPHATIAVIAGRNQGLRRRLTLLAQKHPLRVEGFTPHMDMWLRATDILVTKAGPNSLAEAFVMGLPTVLYAAIPGQEDGNVVLVKKYDAGLWAPKPKKSAEAVLALLNDPPRRKRMAERAHSLATPGAAETIAQRLWQLGLSHPS